MPIKTIPLSSLKADLLGTLNECVASGEPLLVELPDHRLVALQPLPAEEEDSLVDDLLARNLAFQAVVEKSKNSPRRPFMRSGEN